MAIATGRKGVTKAHSQQPKATNISATTTKTMVRVGRAISALVVAFLAIDAVVKLMNLAAVKEASAQAGIPEGQIQGLGAVLLISTLLYAWPRTSFLGAVLLTAYLGGAVATHVRLSQVFVFPIVVAVLAWGGLWLRDVRLRHITATFIGSGNARITPSSLRPNGADLG